MAVGVWLIVQHPEGPADAAFYAVLQAVVVVLIPLVGALIAARQPSNPYGWLWCAVGLCYGVVTMVDGLRRTGPGPPWFAFAVIAVSFEAALCLLVLVVLLFPTGRLP